GGGLMSVNDDLAAHLRVFADMGINGVSRDPAWRARAKASVSPTEAAPPGDAPPDVVSADAAAVELPSTLPELREYIGDCTRCVLHTLGRRQVVFGTGNPDADLMFVGEAPGADEDAKGEPFVGRAGQLLTKIIEAIDL